MAKRKLTIGNKNYSSWSLRGWLVTTRAGAEFDEEVLPLHQDSTRAVRDSRSPTGLVPVLHDGDVLIWDSLAIAEYLHEQHPEAALWPKDPAARAVARSVACQMHSGFHAIRGNMPMNIRRDSTGAGMTPEVQSEITKMCELWCTIREQYGAGGEFLFGDWCIADAFYTPPASRFKTYGIELDGVAAAYADSLLATPEFQAWAEAARSETWSIKLYDL